MWVSIVCFSKKEHLKVLKAEHRAFWCMGLVVVVFIVVLIFISALLLILKYNKVTNITLSIVALNAGLIYTQSRAFGVRQSFFCQHKHSAETTAMTQLPANAARID